MRRSLVLLLSAATLIFLSISVIARAQSNPPPPNYKSSPPPCQAVTPSPVRGAARGADPNAVDKSGVAPLHRAVRNRCALAVRALIEGGADPRAPNRNGSTPMLLATLNTGKSGSGSPGAKEQQREILRILEEHGAT